MALCKRHFQIGWVFKPDVYYLPAVYKSTRGRSTSIEQEIAAPSGRVTRRSVGAANATPDVSTEVPVKRKRGRPPKNKPTDSTKDTGKPSVMQPESITLDNVQTRSKRRNSDTVVGSESPLKARSKRLATDGIVDAENDDTEDEEMLVIDENEPENAESKSEGKTERVDSKLEKDQEKDDCKLTTEQQNEIDEEEEIVSPRKRKAPVIDDDSDTDQDAAGLTIDEKVKSDNNDGDGDDNGDGVVKKRRGRPPKSNKILKVKLEKEAKSKEEAKKIREMAEEMKKKVEMMKKEKSTMEFGSGNPSLEAGSDVSLNTSTASKRGNFTEGSNSQEKITQKTEHGNENVALNVDHIDPISKTKLTGRTSVGSTDSQKKAPSLVKSPGGSTSTSTFAKFKAEQQSMNQHARQPKQEISGGDLKPSSITPEVIFGVDSILQNSSVFRPRADINKGSIIDTVAAKHGMSHLALPVEENVVYHQWGLAGINILIRAKYHGFLPGKGLVHVSPKIEYQPFFGYEKDTVNEVCRNWISVYVRPNSSLLRPRVNPFNSEIMKFDEIDYSNIIPQDSTFSMNRAFTDLHKVLKCVKELPTGQFLLRNNPKKSQVTIMKATGEMDSGVFDLHRHHASFTKTAPPTVVQWVPIDTRLLLPHHRKMGLVPCTYPPKDMVFTPRNKKNKGGSKKKKKKHRNND